MLLRIINMIEISTEMQWEMIFAISISGGSKVDAVF